MIKRIIPMALAALATLGTANARALRVREVGLWSPVRHVAGKKAGVTGGAYVDEDVAMRAIEALNGRLGISANAETLQVRRSDTDRFGRKHVRLRQRYKDLEVDGRELIVHFSADGSVFEVNGDYLDGLALDTSPSVQVADATLVVYCAGDDASKARLAWKARWGRHDVFTDAATGEVFHVRRVAPHARMKSDDLPFDGDELIRLAVHTPFPQGSATTVTGALPAQQGGATVTVGATQGTDGNTYLATRNGSGIEIAVFDGCAAPQFRAAARAAFQANDARWFQTFHEHATFTAYSTAAGEDPANALAIVHNISTVLDYYAAAFGRASYDNRGGRVAAWRFWNEDAKDLDDGFANAFWMSMDGNAAKTDGCFFFGYDLSGKRSETSLDTCGHELTHGITSWSADLLYEAESGALNESFSDIVGIACEFAAQPRAANVESPQPGTADWLFDEDSGETARSLSNPKLYDQPSRYKGREWVDTSDTTEDNDNGGVHSNSGVQNFFFYLLSEGGRGSNEGIAYDLQGIGVEKAVQIAYLALTAYCGPRTDYVAVTSCWDSAAHDLVENGVLTAADYAALAPAWAAVMGTVTTFDGASEVVYDSDDSDAADGLGLLVVVKKANNRGIARVTATVSSNGNKWKFTGKASVATGLATLANRKLGVLELLLGATAATGTLDTAIESVDFVAPRVSPSVESVSGLEGLCAGVAVSGQAALDGEVAHVRYAARKLPPGVKIDAKTGELTGAPRKAGSGTATVSVKCTFAVEGEKRPVTVTVVKPVAWQVAALDDFAQGKFVGDGVAIGISSAGKIGGTVVVDGKKVRLSAKSYASRADNAYVGSGTVRGGVFTFVVDAAGLRGVVTTSSGDTPFAATRNARAR